MLFLPDTIITSTIALFSIATFETPNFSERWNEHGLPERPLTVCVFVEI